MRSLPSAPDLFSLAELTRVSDYGAKVLNVLPSIGDAEDAEAAVRQFRHALRLMGADAGVFLSVIQDGAMRTSHRSLLACDPLWAIEYVKGGWHDTDPWLRHALHDAEPILGSELALRPNEHDFASVSSRLGFASSIIVPAPSSAGTSRVAVLTLGSHDLGFFEGGGFGLVRIVARALAMELHRWMLQTIRRDLIARSRITPAEIALLRHEEEGHTSKMIGAALNVEAKTIDCRFQRVSAKLDAPDRRTAARIARLYGLL
jgi:hypothetical protein